MSKQLQQQVDRLQHEHPIVRRYAVASIFQLLAQHNTYNSKAGHDALQECFKQSSKEVTEETAQQLHAFVPKPGFSIQDAVDMILAAIAVPGAVAVVPSLVDGLFALLQTLVHGAEQAHLGSWRAHPLIKALLAQPLSQPSLLLGMQRILNAASQADAQQPQQLLQQLLLPFVSFVLLQPDTQGKHMAFKTGLHAQLARAVCTLPLLQPYITGHLVSYLAAYSWGDPLEAAWLSSVIPDVVDAVQSVEGTRGDRLAEQLAALLVQLLFEAQQWGFSLQPFLAALRRLASEWPLLLTAYMPLLGACITAAGNSEAASLMQLMAQAAQASPDDYTRSPVYGMLSLPLMSTLALHPSQPLKAWAGYLLTALRPAPRPIVSPASIRKGPLPSAEALFSPVAFHGLPCLLQQAFNILTDMWAWDAIANPGKKTNGDTSAGSRFLPEQMRASPLTWLGQFRAALQSAKTADSQKSEDSERMMNSQQDEVMRMILTALLDHPQLEVQAAAAAACGEAVQAFPLCGISFLPLLIYKLQSSVAQTQHGDMAQGQQAEHAQVQLALTRAIPCMAMHQTALPFVQRALMPFSQKGAPELSHALALKMHTQMWLTTGRGFNGVLGGLSGFYNTHPHASPMLRTVRAACVRDVCEHDSTRGVELVRAIQECLEDKCESVEALGLQAIALLCEDDVLEFYAAWRVVHKALPKIPQQELVAAEWVNLLRHGVLDADVYADKATVIIDMLWSAAGHASPKVRAAAYAALAAYPMDLLETLEALRPLQQCVQLVVREADTAARVEAEVLVGKALAHEHMRRRRYIGSTAQVPAPKQGTPTADPQSVEFQLTQALPKQLLQQSAQQARRASQGVALLLWGPPPPSQGLANPSKADSAQAAQQADAAYHQTFQELVEMPSALGSSQHALLLHSWSRFLARWLSAGKAALGVAKGRHKGGLLGVHESSNAMWRAIASCLDGTSPIAAENAAAAAAALCAVLPAGSHGLVTEVVQKLRRGTESQSLSLCTACALALGFATARLHPTDTQTRQDVLDQLMHFLKDHPRSSFTSACAESLGLLAASSSSSAQPTAADSALALQIWEGLLRMLCTLCPDVLGAVTQLIESSSGWINVKCLKGLQSSSGNYDEACETLRGVMSGLANAVPALAASGAASLPGAFSLMLQRIISDLLDKAATLDSGLTALSPAESVLLEGCCAAQAAACLAAATKQPPAQQRQQVDTLLSEAVQQLRAILAASKHGKLTGTAANSLGSVLNSALTAQSALSGPSSGSNSGLQEPSTAQHAQRDAVQQVGVTESDIKVALTDIMAVVTRVTKLPSAAWGKQGVALGLVALLRGSIVGGHAVHGALLDRPGWTHEAKSALQVVVQLALDEADPRVATLACWGLAAACHAQRHKKSNASSVGGSNAGAQMRALTGLPEDGAMRALAQIVLTGAEDDTFQTPQPILAAALGCLADAPRLPTLDWGTPLKQILKLSTCLETDQSSNPLVKSDSLAANVKDGATASNSSSEVSLGAACLLLALKHGSVVSHGFGELLDQLLSQQQFAQLPQELQQMLLVGLPEALQSLSSQRGAAIAGTLSTPCMLGSSSNSKPEQPSVLSAAAWTGLARYMHSIPHSESAGDSPPATVTEAVYEAVWQLLKQLPLPPILLPGQRLPLPSTDLNSALSGSLAGARAVADQGKLPLVGQVADTSQQVGHQQGEREGAEEWALLQRIWGAACACLQMMPKDKIMEMLRLDRKEEEDGSSVAAFATAVMVQMGKLPLGALQPVRQLCVNQRAGGLAAVMNAVAAALHQGPAQHTILLETLDAVQAGDFPEQALQLLALMVSHWQSLTAPTWPVCLVTAYTPTAAVSSLPYTLPALLQRKAWQSTVEPVTRRLIRLLLPSGPKTQVTGAGQASEQHGTHAQQVSQIAAACLVALRQRLADDAWQHMPHILGCLDHSH